MFKVVPEVCSSLHFFEFLFLHSVLVGCLFLPFVPNCCFESWFPSCHCWFPEYFGLFHLGYPSFVFFIFRPSSISSVSILTTKALNSSSDRLAISSLLNSFHGVLLCYFILALFLCLGPLISCKRWGVWYSPRQGKPPCCPLALPVGDGPEKEQCSSPAL